MIKFFQRFFNGKDASVNSKIFSVFVALILLTAICVCILAGVPPVTATHLSDLIWGLVAIVLGQSGIDVVNQFNRGDGGN